ncbi:MAG TPA: GNAT family N-acetyltransferase, partial [Chloroflexota bacterium]|nr:GNAT family N-acetyltransferase [Chloroflexota bacterium]
SAPPPDAHTGPPRVTFQTRPDLPTRVEIVEDGQPVSRLQIVRITLRIGAAGVPMDGIADVFTEPGHRKRGLARRMLERTIEHMRGGDAALTMLYGIPDFYHRFGYTTTGPEHRLYLTRLDQPAALPAGWSARPLVAGDVPAVRHLYARATAAVSGAASRVEDGWIWARLAGGIAPGQPETDGWEGCQVLVSPAGAVEAYIWRGRGFWYTDMVQRRHPEDLALAEAVAAGPDAARAALARCRQWAAAAAAARGRPVQRVILGLTPEGEVARAAARQDATFEQGFEATGGSMARVLDTGRLLTALAPELARRAAGAGFPPLTLACETEESAARVALRPEPAAGAPPSGAETVALRLPQTVLARLALGVYPPLELLAESAPALDGRQREVLSALFPQRRPHMYWLDRY